MGTWQTQSGLFFSVILAGLLSACSSSDSKSKEDVKLYVNELQASNQTTILDENGEADDWVEIYNGGTEAVDLEGYFASDSATNVMKHKLPAGLSIAAGGFLLFWADGTTSQGAAHLPFKLSASGEGFQIANPDGEVLDATTFAAVDTEVSWARHPDATGPFSWCSVPTPNAPNGAACATQ